MSELKIFEHPKFGKIRTIMEDGKTLFCGLDAATALGYKNPHDALTRHCRGVVKHEVIDSLNRNQPMNFITEGDLCRLAAKSELPGASEFESWIFDDVIPTILRTGTYSVPAVRHAAAPLQPGSAGGVAQLLKVLRLTMKDNEQPPEIISQTMKELCEQFGVFLPDNFVRVSHFQQETLFDAYLPGSKNALPDATNI